MFTRPTDLSDSQVLEVLGAWGLSIHEIGYVAVGFGSHHWRVVANDGRWFVNVDDLEIRRRGSEPVEAPLRRLSAALSTAWALRRSGLEFVVAPVRTPAGAIVEVLNDRFAVALYPYVDGEYRTWGPYPGRAERVAVLDLIAHLHGASDVALPTGLTDDLAIEGRDELAIALGDLDTLWTSGPYAEPARALLRPHTDDVGRALRHYDELAGVVAEQRERMVVTHGEPHRGNTIATASGIVLIDWDTVLIAPPERDLWSLAGEDPSILADYEAATGTDTDRASLDLYRLRWDLTEVAMFVGDFRCEHDDTEDNRVAWSGLSSALDPSRWAVPD